ALLGGVDRRSLIDTAQAQMDAAGIMQLREQARHVTVAPALLDYLQALLHASRQHADIRVGLSPRAGLSLLAGARALALMQQRRFVIPEDIQELFVATAAHRLQPAQGLRREAAAQALLDAVAVD
ncbi:MAG: AAA family ATPase, partial [Xanthomonadales bacterium]|nr:AAA family ATPase [Xanthomonadales bacterium]